MSAILRVIAYTGLPVLVVTAVLLLDRRANTPAHRVEVALLYTFGLMIGSSGLGGFFGHMFLGELVAESIGWAANNPFQQEVAFMNLAVGLTGIIAMTRRTDFRWATAIAAAVISLGATIVHIIDIVNHGNLAPGNVFINISNVGRIAVVFTLLFIARRIEQRAEQPTLSSTADQRWLERSIIIATWVVIGHGSGFGIGFMFDQPGMTIAVTVLGVLLGAGIGLALTARSRSQAAADE